MLEPRPCPFCASIAIEHQVDDGEDFQKEGFIVFRSVCMTCHAAGPSAKVVLEHVIWPINSQEFAEHGIERAILDWNERANDLIGPKWLIGT